ncbi:MAG: SAM-dependent methyltransferase [Patescibacteria group bacterium]|jgi:cyclopropane fatty-acyl-phospholipid synthase-like methyltransferase
MAYKIYDIPYVPSSWNRLETMIELCAVKPGQKTADLGSGDGRVVIALAQRGAEAHGFEIEPERVELAKKNIRKAGLEGKAFIHQANFWDVNLSQFDIITVYGITGIMDRLETKLKKELRNGSKVISNYFTFPTWRHKILKDDVYLYNLDGLDR